MYTILAIVPKKARPLRFEDIPIDHLPTLIGLILGEYQAYKITIVPQSPAVPAAPPVTEPV